MGGQEKPAFRRVVLEVLDLELDPGFRRGEALAKPRAVRVGQWVGKKNPPFGGLFLKFLIWSWTPAFAGVKHWQGHALCAWANGWARKTRLSAGCS
jgi:hypothetical protein